MRDLGEPALTTLESLQNSDNMLTQEHVTAQRMWQIGLNPNAAPSLKRI